MQKIDCELTESTLAIWQRRSAVHLSAEDAREITENVYGFFRTLSEWDRASRSDPAAGATIGG